MMMTRYVVSIGKLVTKLFSDFISSLLFPASLVFSTNQNFKDMRRLRNSTWGKLLRQLKSEPCFTAFTDNKVP